MPFLYVGKYYVGIICALPTEMAAAREILDGENGMFSVKTDAQDHNNYFAGRIHSDNIG
jgi:hypothetical protein